MTYAKALKIGTILGFTLLSGMAQAQVGQPVFDTTTASDIISELNATNAQTQQIATGQNNEATLFQGLAGTNTATAQITGGIMSQGFTNQANTDYQLFLGKGTADLANEYNVNANIIALCEPATAASALATVQQAVEAQGIKTTVGSVGGGWSSGGGGGSGGSGAGLSGATPISATAAQSIQAYNPNMSAPARTAEEVATIYSNFCDKTTDGSVCKGSTKPYEDTNIYPFFTTEFLNITNTVDETAWTLFERHILGAPPENPSTDATYRASAKGVEDVKTQRNKIAYQELARMPFTNFLLNREALVSLPTGVGASINQIFQNAGFTLPNSSGPISEAAVMDALYSKALQEPSNISSISTLDADSGSRKMVALMLMLNYLEYQRSLREEQMHMTLSAILTAVSRSSNPSAQ
jgi:hypothetical protein